MRLSKLDKVLQSEIDIKVFFIIIFAFLYIVYIFNLYKRLRNKSKLAK